LEKTDSCKSGKTEKNLRYIEDDIKVNSYSNEQKKARGHAKIMSCSHLKREEINNSIVFKSSELQEIIEIINKKPKNEIVPTMKPQENRGECCGLTICRIF